MPATILHWHRLKFLSTIQLLLYSFPSNVWVLTTYKIYTQKRQNQTLMSQVGTTLASASECESISRYICVYFLFFCTIFMTLHSDWSMLWMIEPLSHVTSSPLAPVHPHCNHDRGQLPPSSPPPSGATSDLSENEERNYFSFLLNAFFAL